MVASSCLGDCRSSHSREASSRCWLTRNGSDEAESVISRVACSTGQGAAREGPFRTPKSRLLTSLCRAVPDKMKGDKLSSRSPSIYDNPTKTSLTPSAFIDNQRWLLVYCVFSLEICVINLVSIPGDGLIPAVDLPRLLEGPGRLLLANPDSTKCPISPLIPNQAAGLQDCTRAQQLPAPTCISGTSRLGVCLITWEVANAARLISGDIQTRNARTSGMLFEVRIPDVMYCTAQ
ncbi:hypothetical protein VTK56DRAFT_6843 [Thermocarpiscus australiensis]